MTSAVDLDAPPPPLPIPPVREPPRSRIGRRAWRSLTSLITLLMVGTAVIVGLSIGITAPEVSPVAPPTVGAATGGGGLLDELGTGLDSGPRDRVGDGIGNGGQGRLDGGRDGNGGRRDGRQ